MECLGCRTAVCSTELLICVHCKGHYHHNCVNMTSAFYRSNIHDLKKNWQCPSCDNVTSRRRGTDTPVRGLHQRRMTVQDVDLSQPLLDLPAGKDSVTASRASCISAMLCDESLLDASNVFNESAVQSEQDSVLIVPPPAVTRGSITYEDFAALMDVKLSEFRMHSNDHFSKLIDNLKEEFRAILDSVHKQMSSLKAEISVLSDKTKFLESDNLSLRAELSKIRSVEPSSVSEELRDRMVRLQCDIEERDQWTLLNDLEVAGVPESKGESALHIVSAIATKLGMSLDERDIVHAARVGAVRDNVEDGKAAKPSRPRPIVVRLVRRALRDALLKGARVRRGATTADLGLPDHQPRSFYINERLTRFNRILLGKARDFGNRLRWRFVWSKDGRVLARKTETSKVYRIRSECDLDRVFNSDRVFSTDCNAQGNV